MKKYVMSLDQGTTSSRCIIFDRKGNTISVAQKEFTQIYPKPGYVEHDPLDIWSSQISVAMEAMNKASLKPIDIDSIGITNQRETTIIWDRYTGEPVYNAIVWQCRRTKDIIDSMKTDDICEYVTKTTGLIPDAYFSASKIKWILDNVEGVRDRALRGDLLFGTVDTWLIWKLTGKNVHATDYTNASRTMLFDIHNLNWDERIINYFNIPKSILPEVKKSSDLFGYTDETVIGGKIPITGVAGDQQAALFGQCCFDAGEVKNTYGTGCFLLMNTGQKPVESKLGLLTTMAAFVGDSPNYVLEGSVFVAGAAIQWLRDSMGLISSAAESEECCKKVNGTDGVYVVPAFTGLGAPYWNQDARGTITGITRGTTANHIIRATVESLAYEVYDVIKVMETESGIPIKALKVDGGASNNNFLMKFQSDILNVNVLRPSCIETTALGAAYLAGLYTGYWNGLEDIKINWELNKCFEPDMQDDERCAVLNGWKRAVNTTIKAVTI